MLAQKVPAPKVPNPADRDDSDQYTMILITLSKTKIVQKIEEWKSKFSIMSDKMNLEPMIGSSTTKSTSRKGCKGRQERL